MVGETDDHVTIIALRRRTSPDSGGIRHLVTFRVVETRPLTGSGED
jgi:hypothetical protein